MFRRLICSIFLTVLTAAASSTVLVSSPKLVYTTYAGTGPGSIVYALAVDSAGYTYIGGSAALGTPACGFLTKLNQTGTAAVWSVCLPISEIDGIALDSSGYIYVVGRNAPVSYSSVFMKLSPDAKQTIYSTQTGGYSDRIVLDPAGNVYIAGETDSTVQATPGAYMTTGGGAFQAFAAKLNAAGSVVYTTFLDLFDGRIAVDSKGEAWIVGTTCGVKRPGANCDFSVANAFGTAGGIRKLDASGTHLLVSNSFGGGNGGELGPVYYDGASALAVDGNDSVWVAGTVQTSSVPTTPNALEPQRPGPSTGRPVGYALKFSSGGDLQYGTYIGDYNPNQYRSIISVAVDAQNHPYFALNLDLNGGSTVMVLSEDGTSMLTSIAFGGFVRNLALDGNGGLYLAGTTVITEFFASAGAYQVLYPGGPNSGYAAKFDLTTPTPATQLLGMANAASLFNYPEAPVAPGEIVTLFGQNLPSNPVVTFDGRAAPILYADAKQINTVVPFEASPPTTTVSLEGVSSYVLPVWPAVTGLFTADGTGKGQLAALNEDGTVNSSTNPAKVGSVVALYMTGAGAMTPPLTDGQLGPLQPPYPSPVLGVSTLMNNSLGLSNGIPAPVLFAGQAPALIAGAVQVNVQVPAGVPSGNVSLTIYVGNYETQLGPVTIAVQ